MFEKTEWTPVVVRISEVTKHPNADQLELTQACGNPVIIKAGTFKAGDLAAYIPVDTLVPTANPCFSFLAKPDRTHHRVRAIKLRGVFSMGLLVPCPDGLRVGDPVVDRLGLEKYLTPSERAELTEGDNRSKAHARRQANGPKLPVYGLDPYRKYQHVLTEGEEVVITEKIHGCNARYLYQNGRLYVGSHRTMRGASKHRFVQWLDRMRVRLKTALGIKHRAHVVAELGDVWWSVAKSYDLEQKLKAKPGYVLYGEIFGHKVQDMDYGLKCTQEFLAFDVLNLKTGQFLGFSEFVDFCHGLGIQIVPTLYIGPWREELKALADGNTVVGKCIGIPRADGLEVMNAGRFIYDMTGSPHIREGVVIKPTTERFHPNCGRVALKLVGEAYHLRKDGVLDTTYRLEGTGVLPFNGVVLP